MRKPKGYSYSFKAVKEAVVKTKNTVSSPSGKIFLGDISIVLPEDIYWGIMQYGKTQGIFEVGEFNVSFFKFRTYGSISVSGDDFVMYGDYVGAVPIELFDEGITEDTASQDGLIVSANTANLKKTHAGLVEVFLDSSAESQEYIAATESLHSNKKQTNKIRIRAVEAFEDEENGAKTKKYEVVIGYLGEVTWEDTYIVEAEDEDDAQSKALDGDYVDSFEGDWTESDINIIDGATEIKSITLKDEEEDDDDYDDEDFDEDKED